MPDCDDANTIFEIKEIDVDGGIMLVVPVDGSSGSEAWIFEGERKRVRKMSGSAVSSKHTAFLCFNARCLHVLALTLHL